MSAAAARPRSRDRRARHVEAADASQRLRERLALANRLSTKLAPLREEADVARVVVDELHQTFSYYLAVVQRLDADGMLRVIAGAGPLTADPGFLAHEQALHEGVNG